MQINRTWRRRKLRLSKWLGQNHQQLILIAVFGIAFLAVMYALQVSSSYEEKRYDSEYYADSIDFIAALVEAESECNKDKEKRQSGYCKVFSDLVNDRAGLHDLGAQETMALATRGLLHMGMLQTVALFLTLAFVVFAVMQTHGMLNEARQTSVYAKKTLDETKQANVLQLQPYFQFVDAELTWRALIPAFENCAGFTLSVQNTGKSAAFDLGNLVVSYCRITFFIDDVFHHAPMNDIAYEFPVELIVRRSREKDPSVDERSIRSYFPKDEISRKTVSPDEIVQYFVPLPMRNVPPSIVTTSSPVRCKVWEARGHFFFKDTFVAENKPRMCKFRAYSGESAIITMGDGTIHSTVNGGETATGVLEEIEDEENQHREMR